jgi:hypothetical protein
VVKFSTNAGRKAFAWSRALGVKDRPISDGDDRHINWLIDAKECAGSGLDPTGKAVSIEFPCAEVLAVGVVRDHNSKPINSSLTTNRPRASTNGAAVGFTVRSSLW